MRSSARTEKPLRSVYQTEPLAGAEVTVTLADGTEKIFTTDGNGEIAGLNINDVRNGLSFTYKTGNQTYTLHYQVEADTIITVCWLSAMLPFGIIVLISAVCIALDVLLRKLLYKKEKLPVGKTGVTARDMRKKRFVFGFQTVRWIIMILSFALLIFGSRLTGTVFSEMQLPVFACPYNFEQLTSAGCYYFSHLDVLFSESWREILAFFGTFIICVVLFGRVLCGFVCPLGFVQDVAHEARQAPVSLWRSSRKYSKQRSIRPVRARSKAARPATSTAHAWCSRSRRSSR